MLRIENIVPHVPGLTQSGLKTYKTFKRFKTIVEAIFFLFYFFALCSISELIFLFCEKGYTLSRENVAGASLEGRARDKIRRHYSGAP